MSTGVEIMGMGRGKGRETRFYRAFKRLLLQERATSAIYESEQKREEVENNVIGKWEATLDGESLWFLKKSIANK